MPRLSIIMIRAALLYLGIGMTFGSLMLWNKALPLDGRIWLLLPLHIEFLLMGWLVQLAAGVMFWIMPRFMGQFRYGDVRPAWLAAALWNTGIFIYSGTMLAGYTPLIGRGVQLVSALLFVGYIWSRVKPFGETTPSLLK